MRIMQARFVGLVMILVAAIFLDVSPGIAQRGGGSTGAGSATPSPGTGTPTPTPSPTPTPTPGNIPSRQTQPPANTPSQPRPIWITGRVLMYDGGPPPESVTIERLCSTNSVRAEGYTDSKGAFSFNLGQNNGVFADASTSSFGLEGTPGFGLDNTGGTNSSNGGANNPNSDMLLNCELRARLPGYRSETISLAGRRVLDSPDVGVIMLYPIAGIQGLITSATSGQAPKEARKAYEKGLEAVKKKKLDQAEPQFRKAVQIYPKHAEAWLELGKILEQSERYSEAREAYASALAADSKFVYPYQQLYRMALREQNWKDVAEETSQLLRLDPFEFPAAYYFNALAHLQLKEYAAAEKSAHQAVEADKKHSNPQAHYLLGAIQIQTKDWAGAAESFRAYLKAAPDAPEKAQIEKTLGQLDQQISRVQTASQDSAAQQ
jgi:tetratricopeptide (TPR) repeat protein